MTLSQSLSVISIFLGIQLPVISRATDSCPQPAIAQARDLPPCGASKLVGDHLPVRAIVLGDTGGNRPAGEFAADLVKKVFTATSENPPIVILPVNDKAYQKIRLVVSQMNFEPEKKQLFLKSLIQVGDAEFPWHQDGLQSFIDPEDGMIVLREISGYRRNKGLFKRIVDATSKCGIKAGPKLDTGPFVSGHAGGNIEALPGGICMLGDSDFKSSQQWRDYADQICAEDSAKRIRVPTSWLSTGHTDEVIKVIGSSRGEAQCNFAVVLASPRKALELLRENPSQTFLDFYGMNSVAAKKIRRVRTYLGSAPKHLCMKITKYRKLFIQIDSSQTKMCSNVETPKRQIASSVPRDPANFDEVIESLRRQNPNCENLTNRDVFQLMTRAPEFSIAHELIQKAMDQLKSEVQRKLQRALPQCQVDFIEAPTLFYENTPKQKPDGTFELAMQKASSVLPNPINSIFLNRTVISPDPSNLAFRDYLTTQYQQRGLRVEFVDTFDFAHEKGGNLHCVTNTFHICSPRAK